jgi:hypothetical protein
MTTIWKQCQRLLLVTFILVASHAELRSVSMGAGDDEMQRLHQFCVVLTACISKVTVL